MIGHRYQRSWPVFGLSLMACQKVNYVLPQMRISSCDAIKSSSSTPFCGNYAVMLTPQKGIRPPLSPNQPEGPYHSHLIFSVPCEEAFHRNFFSEKFSGNSLQCITSSPFPVSFLGLLATLTEYLMCGLSCCIIYAKSPDADPVLGTARNKREDGNAVWRHKTGFENA